MPSVLAITPPQGAEWLVILVLAVLLFGAKKLPDLASSMGKSITNFKRGMKEGAAEEDDTTDGPKAEVPANEAQVPPATQTSRESS